MEYTKPGEKKDRTSPEDKGDRGCGGHRRGDIREPGRVTDHLENLKTWAGRLGTEVYALYLAYRDPRVPLHARVFAACVVGYAFSPIDFIPVLGYLDDLVLTPSGSSSQ